MTLYVIIDESGDTGKNGSEFFVLSSIVTKRSRILLQPSKLIENKHKEIKFYNSTADIRLKILSSISETGSNIIFIAVDKHNYMSKYYGMYGNELYSTVLNDLIDDIFIFYQQTDTKIMMDETRQIRNDVICNIVKKSSMNILSFKKYTSSSNKCIQLADFISGAIYAHYEHNDNIYCDKIKKMILRP